MSYMDSAVAQIDGSTDRQELIVRTLRGVLESSHFSKSKRYPALLEFAVRTALEDPSAFPKERTVGIKVFGRSVDYDTSSDPVVRIAAGEVRRRLNLYFSEHPEAPVRIDLPAGSYRAEFHIRPSPPPGAAPTPHADLSLDAAAASSSPALDSGFPANHHANSTEAPAEELPREALRHDPRPRGARARTVAAALALVAAAAAVGTGVWRHLHAGAQPDFWSPMLSGDTSAEILVGQKADTSTPSTASPTVEQRPNLVLDDAIVAGQVCSVFREYGNECRIEPAATADPKDLDGKPVVLIGGFNNLWTMRLLAAEPYRLGHNAAGERTVIERTPGGDVVLGTVGPVQPGSLRLRDYAVIGRFRTDATHSEVVVMAGLGIPGTDSAAQYILSPDKMRALLSQAPRDWNGQNLEAVLQIDAVQGTTPEVQVIASRFW